MKAQFTVLLFPRTSEFSQAEILADSIGRQHLIRGSSAYFEFSFGDESEVAELYEAASQLGFRDQQLLTRKEYVFTTAEMLSAPLLWLSVTTAPKGDGGPTFGTEYDLSRACGRCGSGARQITPLVLNRSETPTRGHIYQTLDGEFLISEALALTLGQSRVTGARLWQALARHRQTLLPWYQILPDMELPPMSELTRGILRSRACPECSMDGHFHAANEPIEIAYDCAAVNVDTFPDIVQTYERFGSSVIYDPFEKSHFARPLILVKPKVFQIFKEQKVRGVHFDPVRLIKG